MMNTPKEADFPLKKEANNTSRDHERPKASSTSLSSSQWLKPKQDPRIVRVSRAVGGKDRHSKVFTIRGLRDRRVRLSVPTAIHLYDLQNRLGLNQPSKVFDWLLNAAKHEIDELPPLPIPQGNFTLGYNFPSHHDHQLNSKKVICDHDHDHEDKQVGANVNLQNNNLLPRPNHSSFLGMLNTMPSLGYQWELPNNASSSSNLGNHIGILTQSDVHNINVVPFNHASTLSLATGGTSASQIYVCNPNGESRQQPYFSSIMEMDIARQMNNHHHHYHQLLSSSSDSQNLLANSLNQSQHHADKDEDFPSK